MPDRRGRTARLVVGGAAVVVVLASVGALIDRAGSGHATVPTLESLLVPTSAGEHPTSERPLVAQQVSDEFLNPGLVERTLGADGYESGVEHVFRTAQPVHETDVELWEFGNAVDASEFYTFFQGGNQPGSTISQLLPAGDVPTGFDLIYSSRHDGEHVVIGYAIRGRVMIHVRYAADGSADPAAVTAVLSRQYDRLPAT